MTDLAPALFSSLAALPWLPLGLGMLIGVVMALSGAGGGILSVPLLVFFLHQDVAEAAPIALLAVAMAAGTGAGIGLWQHIVRYRAALLIGLCGLITAPAGVWLAGKVPNPPLLVMFAGILVLIALRSLRGTHNRGKRTVPPCVIAPATGRIAWNRTCARALAGSGVLAGFLSGLLGVGGGFVIVPGLRRHTDIPTESIIATSLAVMALVSLGGIGASLAQGRFNPTLALPFAGGAVAGLLLSRVCLPRPKKRHLDIGFAGVCLTAAALLVLRAAGQMP